MGVSVCGNPRVRIIKSLCHILRIRGPISVGDGAAALHMRLDSELLEKPSSLPALRCRKARGLRELIVRLRTDPQLAVVLLGIFHYPRTALSALHGIGQGHEKVIIYQSCDWRES